MDCIIRKALEQRREESKAEGRLEMLLEILTDRFGTLPDWAVKKIEGATEETRKGFVLKFLTASSIEELLG